METTQASTPISHQYVRFTDGFWQPRLEVNRRVTIPLMYTNNINNGVLAAYNWDWWSAEGEPPWHIWIGDLGKLIEAAAYSLATHPDAELESQIDAMIDGMLQGQKEDGYLYPNALRRTQVFGNLLANHELYEIGHDIEAAVAYAQATGKTRFLDGIRRAADLLARTFGMGPGQIRGYDGHPEIELALMKLYRASSEPRYLELAQFFIDERGQPPLYFAEEGTRRAALGFAPIPWYRDDGTIVQAHQPLRDQQDAVGHAVRALYLYAGAVDVTAATGDSELLAVCRRLWRSVTRRRMYLTGGVGSSPVGEEFTFDYDLPNETGYAETCAAIALVFFAHRLLLLDCDAEYADVMERALYNGVLSGVGLDGRHFFYANPLAVHPLSPESTEGHQSISRKEWFGCACCPPNIARLLASLGQYCYATSEATLFVHLYTNGTLQTDLAGVHLSLAQHTEYPWDGTVIFILTPERETEFTLALRIPGWCRQATLQINGEVVALEPCLSKGYVHLRRRWTPGDRVELILPMPIERMEAHPAVRMDCTKVALQRGPLVYCLEEVDNGPRLTDLRLSRTAELLAEWQPDLLGGVMVIRGEASRRELSGWDNVLYRPVESESETTTITAIPYFAWANRHPGEMLVWLHEDNA